MYNNITPRRAFSFLIAGLVIFGHHAVAAAECNPKDFLIQNIETAKFDSYSAIDYAMSSSETFSSNTQKKMGAALGYSAYSGSFNNESAKSVAQAVSQAISYNKKDQINSFTSIHYLPKEAVEAYKACLGAQVVELYPEADPIELSVFTMIAKYNGGFIGAKDNVTFEISVENGEIDLPPIGGNHKYQFNLSLMGSRPLKLVGRDVNKTTIITMRGVGYDINALSIYIPPRPPVVTVNLEPIKGPEIKVRIRGKYSAKTPATPVKTSCIESSKGWLVSGTEHFRTTNVAGTGKNIVETWQKTPGFSACATLTVSGNDYTVQEGYAEGLVIKSIDVN